MILPATKKEFAIPSIIRPVDDSCVLWIKGSDSRRVGTVLADLSKKGNTGQIFGATWANSPIGHSVLSFDGVDDYVEVPYNPTLNPDEFTILAWAMVKGNVGTFRSVITSRIDSPRSGYIIYADSNNNWAFWMGDGTVWGIITGPAIVLNEWYFLVAWYKAGEMRFYVNNTLYGPAFYTLLKNTQRPLRIGAGATEGSPALFFNGLIGEVRIYNRALLVSETSEQYNYLKSLFK